LHTDLGLMPLFHGLPVEIASHLAPTAVVVIFRVMLMAVMLAIGVLINREALLWCRDRRFGVNLPLPV
jgi:hypothetical protein